MACRVLSGKVEVQPYSKFQEDLAMLMEFSQCVVHLLDAVGVMDVAPGQVAEFNESAERAHHAVWDKALDSRKIDLVLLYQPQAIVNKKQISYPH